MHEGQYNLFISHYVQIKAFDTIKEKLIDNLFISHYVQIKDLLSCVTVVIHI